MEVQAGTFNPADFSWQGLTMTPAAAAHIRDLMRKQPDKKGLRLGIKTSGCAGFGYVLEMIAEPAPDDLLFESDGAKLFAPLQAMPFIDGTELDYVREGLNEPRFYVSTSKSIIKALINMHSFEIQLSPIG